MKLFKENGWWKQLWWFFMKMLDENAKWTSGCWAVPSSEKFHYVCFDASYINYRPIETIIWFQMNKILAEILLLNHFWSVDQFDWSGLKKIKIGRRPQ